MPASEEVDPHSALPRGTRLGEFEIRRVLGIGGFGIVYLAFDHDLEREVAVKEYMPSSLAGRTATLEVSLLSQAHAETFALGLRSFVNEARLLARFDHPSLVKVHRFWEANHTAYMAMPFYAGDNLHRVRQRMAAPPDEDWLRSVLDPLLGALERLHGEAVFHRDISPDNVILLQDGHHHGRPVLLDFGAARRVISDKSMALTAILKPAYAPIEQYGEAASVKQGPWTDLYALGATLHYLLLGRAPMPATARTVQDDAEPLTMQGITGCSDNFLRCVDWMLRPRPAERPQSVAELREALDGRRPVPEAASGNWARTQIVAPPGPGATTTDHDATVVVPRSGSPAPARPADPDATIVAPRTGPPAASSAGSTAGPAAAPANAGGPAGTADLHIDAGDGPAPAGSSRSAPRRWPLAAAAGAAGVVIAAWVGLRPSPAPEPAAPVARPVAAAASAPASAVTSVASPASAAGSAVAVAVPPPTASAGRSATAATVAPAASPVMAKVPAPAPPPVKAAAVTAPAPKSPGAKAGKAASAVEPDEPSLGPSPPPLLPPPLPTTATAAPRPAPLLPPPATDSGRPAAPTAAPAAPTPAPAPAAAAAAVHTPAPAPAVAPTAAAPSPAPALPSPTSAATRQAARDAARDAEPVVQSRALGPGERCEGRGPVAFRLCLENQCRLPELREHPECVKLRR